MSPQERNKRVGLGLCVLVVLVTAVLIVKMGIALGTKEISLSPALSRGIPTGTPAPAFTLDLLDGGEFDLAQQKEKNIVILDFWATWCGPCANAMPVLAQVAREYRSRGVRLYSVNLQENPQVIRLFLKRHRLNLDVALDRDGEVGKLYGADSIPETVVIGKDGRVQAVHVGFLPTLKSELTKELDTLLAGESLVGEIE